MSSAHRVTGKPKAERKKSARGKLRFFGKGEVPKKLLILDQEMIVDLIAERQRLGTDRYDEVWEGVYIVPPLATLAHQDLVMRLCFILFNVITLENRGKAYPGTNVSDRRAGWKRKFRAPDVVVVLNESAAVDCDTHYMKGPDFLAEIQSPGDQTDEKIPFYEQLKVRELLIIHRDTRALKLLRHDGEKLLPVEPSVFRAGKWLVSKVVPLAFRRKSARSGAAIEVERTDGTPGIWTI
jgi:hypothetical protein